MSVLFETSVGDIIVDLETSLCPTLSLNFLKLCKSYYYNFNSFHHIIPSFIAQTGDPTDSGNGGSSIWNSLPSTSREFQKDPYFLPPSNELPTTTRLKHTSIGTLSMAMSRKQNSSGGTEMGGCGSQFFFTLGENLDYLDGKHLPFGKVIEGLETLSKLSEALLDQQGRPLRDIRIRHVIVLDDPFPDPEGLSIPPESPVPTPTQLASLRVGEDEELEPSDEDPETLEQKRREHEAKAQALTLEMVGDLPFADVAPPENVLFVCKLNQVTSSEDLELIFSRFGEILSCEIIRDSKTGDSLQYAFIEFKERESAEKAYVKMDNVLVDDRRIHVDFSQSVSKLHNSWVYNKTGGRPPPNKHDQQSAARRRGGGSEREDEGSLLFDMNEVDSSNRNRRQQERRGGGGGGRREHYNDDRRRRDDDYSSSWRRDERERSPRGGGASGSYHSKRDSYSRGGGDRDRDRDRVERERERDRDRDRDRYGRR